MAVHNVENSNGTGTLFSGGEALGRVPYSITITMETVEVTEIGGSVRETYELRSASGRLLMRDDLLRLDSNDLLLKDWLLVLEDGRRARIMIELGDMRTGRCSFTVRGDIEG